MKDFICSEDYKPLLPNGIYEAQCVNYDSKFILGKTRKVFLNFKILDSGVHNGKLIFQAFNMPYNGKIKMGSKYYKTWVMVNGWQKPSRNTKMLPRLFRNKIFKIRTWTAKPKHHGKDMPDDFLYSVVDEILEVVAG
tara:strand:- start:27 stop:437 length:411 start_codon:yes stop_codon:yes gene_type:complete